ncbi:MAG: acyltransferase [Clostridium sp.]|uniref:acyltransferase family protein n=1 Tax=Clostridium sp. TaxID=1506 RepID=UPI0030475B0F
MIKSLKGLRALAMIGIFLFHSGLLLKGTFLVTFFFILSGFMAYYTLYNRSDMDSNRKKVKWFINKVIKFYPIHIITFGMSIFIRWDYVLKLKENNELIIRGFLNLTLLQSFFEKYAMSFNGLSWFLSTTIIIYMVSFMLLKMVKKVRVVNCKYFIVVIVILQSISNYISYFGIYSLYMYCNPFYRVFDFLIGMLTARIVVSNKESNIFRNMIDNNSSIIEVGIIIIFIMQYILSFKLPDNMAYYSIIFSFALYIYYRQGGIVSKYILSSEILQKLANISFEFYMIHELILIVFRKLFFNLEMYWVLKCSVIAIPSFIISLGLAILVHKFITKKISKVNIKSIVVKAV